MFLINSYPKKRVSKLEAFFKDLRYRIRRFRNRKINGKNLAVLCYPEYPKSGCTVSQAIRALNLNVTNNPNEEHQSIFIWEDETEVYNTEKYIQKFGQSKPLFNVHCTDISKEKVDREFERIFDYGIQVNPLKYSGLCVEKCNENAGGIINEIQCPIQEKKPDFVYQKVIDNAVNSDYIADMRVLIFGSDIPFVIDKWIPKVTRYKKKVDTDLPVKYHYKKAQELLSAEEQKQILKLAKRMGLDCGEMDVLRDASDGKIYVVDVNKTPTMKISRFSEAEQVLVLNDLRHYFSKHFYPKSLRK
ncbi:MAG: hypothetical protein ACPG4W_02990 [Flavobacteriales bacterium]